MKHLLFHINSDNKYKIAVLIKESALNKSNLEKYYINPMIESGLQPDSILSLTLKYNEMDKCPAKLIKSHLQIVLKSCVSLGVTTLLVADGKYFKTLTKEKKSEPHHGYIKKCQIEGFDHINVILTVSYKGLFYNPDLQSKIDMSINTITNYLAGNHVDLGTNIIHKAKYPVTNGNIQHDLMDLLSYPMLTCDIETFSLSVAKAGIGTIAFAKNEHEGIAFCVDYNSFDDIVISNLNSDTDLSSSYGYKEHNKIAKEILLIFFEQYKGTLIFHRGTFDIKILIYELFMGRDFNNIEGLIKGLHVFYPKVHDTLLITYLATNTTAGNVLGLKPNSFEFSGNYANDAIKDICNIEGKELLEYNLIDCLSTWYLFNKNFPKMVEDQQLNIYYNIYLPSMKTNTYMELVGMPLSIEKVNEADNVMSLELKESTEILKRHPLIKDFQWLEQRLDMIKANLLLKKKIKPIEDFKKDFNPGSDLQLRKLLYRDWGFKIIDKTDGGEGSVGKKTLKKLLNVLIQEHNLTEEEIK